MITGYIKEQQLSRFFLFSNRILPLHEIGSNIAAAALNDREPSKPIVTIYIFYLFRLSVSQKLNQRKLDANNLISWKNFRLPESSEKTVITNFFNPSETNYYQCEFI
jgi:hypothetical protein